MIDRVIGWRKRTRRWERAHFPRNWMGKWDKPCAIAARNLGLRRGGRRCGWFDAVGRYAVRINGMDCLAITKLDVLDELEEIKVCVAYEINGQR